MAGATTGLMTLIEGISVPHGLYIHYKPALRSARYPG